MTCRELAELLIDYLDGALTPEQVEQVRTHLAACRPCVHYVATYELTIQITRRLPPTPPPPALLDRLRSAAGEK